MHSRTHDHDGATRRRRVKAPWLAVAPWLRGTTPRARGRIRTVHTPMAVASPQRQDAWCDGGIDDSALAALDIDAAIAASAREVESDAVVSKNEVMQLREELRQAQERVEELTSLLRLHSPSLATGRSHQRSPASRRQERVPLTASLSTNRSPEAVRLKKAWCAAHASKRQGRNEGRSLAAASSPGTTITSPVVPASHAATGSQTSPQGASPNIRLPRTKMNQLHSEFACSICYELYMEPVSTPCGHNYCRCCLATSFERLGRNCPQCRTRIPAGTKLQPNTALASGASDLLSPVAVRLHCLSSRSTCVQLPYNRICARVRVFLLHFCCSNCSAVRRRAGLAARGDVLASCRTLTHGRR